MKLLFPAVLLVLSAAATAAPEALFNSFRAGAASSADKCAAEGNKIPQCAVAELNAISKTVCANDYNLECACRADRIDKILSLGADSFDKSCGGTLVNQLVQDFCSCYRGDEPPSTSTTTSANKPPATCAVQLHKIPECVATCINTVAAKLCKGDVKCGCDPKNLDIIINDSKVCASITCKGVGFVFPPLQDWCRRGRGRSSSTTSSTSAPIATATSTTISVTSSSSSSTISPLSSVTPSPSASSTDSSRSTSTTTGSISATTTLISTLTTTTVYTITSCAPEVTACPARVTTDTVVRTITWCPGSETATHAQSLPTSSGLASSVPGNTQSSLSSLLSSIPVSTGSPIKTQPPTVAGACASMQRNVAVVAGSVAIIVGLL